MDAVDCRHDVVLDRPQQCLLPARRGDLRQRRAPCAAAHHCQSVQRHAFTPAPRTLSASSSSGQRARAGASSPSISPAAKRSAPAQPIIAALSVHSHAGGTEKVASLLCGELLRGPSAPLVFAATPPATTRLGASLTANARRVRSTKQSTTACWKLAAISAKSVMRAARHRPLDRGLQSGEGEMRLLAALERARQRHRLGVALGGERLDRRAAGIAQPHRFGGLVERLAGGIVDRRGEAAILADTA